MIDRKEYMEVLKRFKDKDLIKVITGIRRCGKSTLFKLYIDYLKSIGIEEKNIVHINLENPIYNFNDYMELYDYINKKIGLDEKYYVFIDEVQNVPKFQKAVDGLYINKNIDLYITGSNAYVLSGELATLLSGRYIEIKMLPLSFQEYVSYYNENEKDNNKLFLDFMKFGGMPGNIELEQQDQDLNLYLDGIFSSVIYKDIMERNNINNKILLESIIKFIFDSIGSLVSIKKISDTLTSKNLKTSNHTVENYINALLESYLIYKVDRFDVKGKNLLNREYKYYIVDTGLRNHLLGRKAGSDMGHILENIVYLELVRRGYKVYSGKVDDLEIDFVAENREGIKYFQVAYNVLDEKTLERELKSLEKTKDHYPKTILTLDYGLDADYNGIKKINVINWLLNK